MFPLLGSASKIGVKTSLGQLLHEGLFVTPGDFHATDARPHKAVYAAPVAVLRECVLPFFLQFFSIEQRAFIAANSSHASGAGLTLLGLL